MIPRDVDAESANVADRYGLKEKGGNVFSLQQVTTCLSIGSWFLLCLSEATTDIADGDGSWWSHLLGGMVLFVALVLLLVSNLQSHAERRKRITAVLPKDLDRRAEPRVPGSSMWYFVIHGHLMLGTLFWISVHVANKQSQQVWCGVMTLYSIMVGFTVISFRSRWQASESDCNGQSEVGTASHVESTPKHVHNCRKQRWQPLFRDPSFGLSVEGAPLNGSRASLKMINETETPFSRLTTTDDADEANISFARCSMKSRARFKFVEDISVVSPPDSPIGSPSGSQQRPPIPQISRGESEGLDLLVLPPFMSRQSSKNSRCSRRSGPSERRLSQASALSDVSVPSQVSRHISRGSILSNVSALMQSRPSQCSVSSGMSVFSSVCASPSAPPGLTRMNRPSVERSSSGFFSAHESNHSFAEQSGLPRPSRSIDPTSMVVRSVSSSDGRPESDF